MHTMIIAVTMAIAELFGALICLKTKDNLKKMFLTCLGLGFGYAVVLTDILPDAAEHYRYAALICIIGALFVYGVDKYGKHIGGYAAVSGLAFHDFCEGAILTVLGSTASPFVILAFVLHKLPEGIISFSLLKGIKDRTKFCILVTIPLLIPLGTFIGAPEYIEQPVLAFSSGVILFIISKSLVTIISDNKHLMPKVAGATAVGAILGAAPCLMLM